MNSTTQVPSRKNGIVSGIGILILLIGTATGNAYAMLAMSIAALLVFAAHFRQGWSRNAQLMMHVAAVAAFVTAIVVAMLM